MSWEADLLRGVAQALHDANVGTYRPSTAYLASETAIVFGDLPPSPDRCIALNAYSAGDSINQNRSTPRLNVKLRGLPNNALDVSDLGGAVFDALQGLSGIQMQDAHLTDCSRVSSLPFEVDDNRRHVRSDNYRTDVNTPSTSVRSE